jgi:hypothetical protein
MIGNKAMKVMKVMKVMKKKKEDKKAMKAAASKNDKAKDGNHVIRLFAASTLAMKATRAMKVVKGPKVKNSVKAKPAGKKATWDVRVAGDKALATLASMRASSAGGDAASDLGAQLSATPSLDEKLDMLRKADLNAQDKSKILSGSAFSHSEWKAINGRYASACKTDPELKQDKEDAGASKAEHRKASSAWIIDPSKGEVYKSLKYNVSATQAMLKKDIWQSLQEMYLKWTENELQAHLGSGRIITREDPRTPGVWEYKDRYMMEGSKSIIKEKRYSRSSSSHLAGSDAVEDMQDMDDVWAKGYNDFDAGQEWADTGLEWL